MAQDSMSLPIRQNAVFRFAPSPNGALHLGHALSAYLNADLARQAGGRLLLRIEDIDVARCTPALEAGMIRDLAWLGIAWEEPVRRQSMHFDDYRAALAHLQRLGLVYPSFMSRGEIKAYVAQQEAQGRRWPRDPDGAPHYPERDKRRPPAEVDRLLASGRPYAHRLDMDKAMSLLPPLSWQEMGEEGAVTQPADPSAWGDVILSRSDAPSSYHLSVVVDDALQGVTHVVRGMDLFQATAVHRVLQRLLDLPAPIYRHHRLILGQDGRKLSKSAASTGLADLRAQGLDPSDIRRLVGL